VLDEEHSSTNATPSTGPSIETPTGKTVAEANRKRVQAKPPP